MKRILLSLVVISCSFFARGQNEYLAAAEKYYSKGDFSSASEYYEKYLAGKKPKNTGDFNPYAVSANVKPTAAVNVNKETIYYKLAESYRKLNYPSKAAPYYRKALDEGAANHPLTRYYYATMQRALGNYEEAENEFNAFLNNYTEKDIFAEDAQREVNSLQYLKKQLAKSGLELYTLNKAPGLNSTGGNYAPVWMNNTLYFTSTRPIDSSNKSAHINRIFEASYGADGFSNVQVSGVPQPKDMHQGVISITPDGNVMFFSRWDLKGGRKMSSIYSSKKSGDKWSEPVAVDILNMSSSSSQQPAVMPDGKHILFASDREGGVGGFDIYYATLDEAGNPGTPLNLGSMINTKYDEQAPFYHGASNTLVFSSNGRTGMGGYDFFYSKGTLNNFSEPVNFGYPVNSIKDDIYFASRGPARNILEDVVISSDRDAACCLELFSVSKKKALKTITGTVVSCETEKPLPGVAVSFADPVSGKVLMERTTDAGGSYSFTLEEYQPIKATANREGYFSKSMEFNSPVDAESDFLMNSPLCLTEITEKPITLENVYYDFNADTPNKQSYPALDNLVKLLKDNPTMEIELAAHADSVGTDEYNLALSDRRANSVVNYLVKKGINRERLSAKGYGETMPVADNTNPDGSDNPEGRQKNRRTEFRVLKK